MNRNVCQHLRTPYEFDLKCEFLGVGISNIFDEYRLIYQNITWMVGNFTFNGGDLSLTENLFADNPYVGDGSPYITCNIKGNKDFSCFTNTIIYVIQ